MKRNNEKTYEIVVISNFLSYFVTRNYFMHWILCLNQFLKKLKIYEIIFDIYIVVSIFENI